MTIVFDKADHGPHYYFSFRLANRTAVTSYPFVGFHFGVSHEGPTEIDDEEDGGDIDWESLGRPDPCAACHRRQRENMSTMYLAGSRDGYKSKQVC